MNRRTPPMPSSAMHGRLAATSRLWLRRGLLLGIAGLLALPLPAQTSNFGSNSSMGSSTSNYGSSTNSSSLNSNSRSSFGSDSSDDESRESRRERRKREREARKKEKEGYASRRSSKRDEDKRDERSGDTDEGAATGVNAGENAGDPTRARAGEKSTVARRDAPKGGGGGGEGGGSAEQGLAEIKISPDYKENALFFNPSFTFLEAGDRFNTALRYYNGLDQPVTDLDVWVQYDPSRVEPIWVDTADLGTSVSATTEAWPESGYLRIQARLPEPLTLRSTPLLTLHWRARDTVGPTKIRLAAPEGHEVGMRTADGTNTIASNKIGSQSVVNFSLSVGPQKESELGLRLVNRERNLLPPPDRAVDTRVRLALLPPREPLTAGSIGTVDLALINPENVPLDQIDVLLAYDPTAIQILDADQDNYIEAGLNIFDGDFHEAFPFDLHFINEADPTTAAIRYRVGSATGPRVYRSGVLARIVFRVLKPVGTTPIRFELRNPVTKMRGSDVSALGRSLLGKTDALAREALHGIELTIAPPATAAATEAATEPPPPLAAHATARTAEGS